MLRPQILFFYCIALLLMANGLNAQVFRPSVSLIGNYTYTCNYSHIENGLFSIHNRIVNGGMEVSNKFFLNEQFFLKTGIRYNQFRVRVAGLNQISALHNKPDPLIWTKQFESLSIPISFGKKFVTKQGRAGDFFVGITNGFIMNTYSKSELNKAYPVNINNFDWFAVQLIDSVPQTPLKYYSVLDVGMNIQPIKSIKKLTVGLLCNIQLNKTGITKYLGLTENTSKQERYDYNMTLKQRYINLGLTASYQFGRNKANSKNLKSSKCPNTK